MADADIARALKNVISDYKASIEQINESDVMEAVIAASDEFCNPSPEMQDSSYEYLNWVKKSKRVNPLDEVEVVECNW